NCSWSERGPAWPPAAPADPGPAGPPGADGCAGNLTAVRPDRNSWLVRLAVRAGFLIGLATCAREGGKWSRRTLNDPFARDPDFNGDRRRAVRARGPVPAIEPHDH